MNNLVVYYSRTGTTNKVGEEIAKGLEADLDEISDQKNRGGKIGWLKGGWDAWRRKTTEIEVQKNPEEYHLIVIGTPVWAGKMTPAVRTYLKKHNLNNKKIAFFTTQAGEDAGEALEEMKEKTVESELIGTLSIQQEDVQENNYRPRLTGFIERLKQHSQNEK